MVDQQRQQVPSVNRSVHYTAVIGGDNEHVCRAAVITSVNDDDTVSLLVHHPTYDERLHNIAHGDGPGRWHWAEFVPPRESSTAAQPPLQFPPVLNERDHRVCYRATKNATQPTTCTATSSKDRPSARSRLRRLSCVLLKICRAL